MYGWESPISKLHCTPPMLNCDEHLYISSCTHTELAVNLNIWLNFIIKIQFKLSFLLHTFHVFTMMDISTLMFKHHFSIKINWNTCKKGQEICHLVFFHTKQSKQDQFCLPVLIKWHINKYLYDRPTIRQTLYFLFCGFFLRSIFSFFCHNYTDLCAFIPNNLPVCILGLL